MATHKELVAMARPSVGQRHAATWSAARVLFDGISRLGALAVVFTATSYLLGTVSLSAEYKAIGAQWYVRTMSFDRVVMAGAMLNLQFVIGVLLLLPGQVHLTPMSPKMLMLGELASLAIGIAFYAIGDSITIPLPSGQSVTGFFLAGTAFLWAAVLVLVESITRIRDGASGWPRPWQAMLYAVVFLAALSAPTVMGKDVGMGRVKQVFSNEPLARLAGDTDREWRLVSAAGDSVLLVDTSQPERWEFRVVKLESTLRIFSALPRSPAQKAPATSASAPAAQVALQPSVPASSAQSARVTTPR